FLGKALRTRKDWPPLKINTDKNDAYPQAIRELKQQGKLAPDVEHRQVKYLNNRLEADHGGLKRLIKPTRGFQSMKTAYATIKEFEVMRMLPQRERILLEPVMAGEMWFVNTLFGLLTYTAIRQARQLA